jgi:hypothetical protein
MPNYVYTRLTISGPADELEKFKDHIDTPPAYIQKQMDDEEEAQAQFRTSHNGFSFHSFVTPAIDKYEEYHTPNGSGPDGPYGNTMFNWYNWNLESWGTKWDASDVEVWANTHNNRIDAINIRFQTAWSPAEPVFIALAQQWPNITVEGWWEEEQGYGGEFILQHGALTTTNVWDIPESHADWDNLGRTDECRCSWSESDDFFDDCPGKTYPVDSINEYEVFITHKYVVTAPTPEVAYRAVVAKENDFDMPEYSKVLSVQYDAVKDTKLTKENVEEVNN